MSAIKLKENLYSVGVLNPSLRVFDIVMEARYGTSYLFVWHETLRVTDADHIHH